MSMLATKCIKTLNGAHQSVRTVYSRCRIGNRDWVGFGQNGSANYQDNPQFPFPAVRFKENTKDIWALRQKEKGDWKCLCCEEKKALYRASFCQTYAEFQHPTGTWKLIMGSVLFLTTWAMWSAMFYHYYVNEPLPPSLSKESQKAQLRRILEIRANPIDGISSRWDYDNDRWKPGMEPSQPPIISSSATPETLIMKCAVAIVLALIGIVVAAAAPDPSLAYGIGHVVPSVSVSSSVINHGVPYYRPYVIPAVVKAPVLAPVVTWGKLWH